MWWIGKHQRETIISALGNGNNSIDILPDRKLVFVFRANTFKGKSIPNQKRWQIIKSVVAAQDGRVNPHARLVDVPATTPIPAHVKEIQLSKDSLNELPIDLPRQFPKSFPKTIRDQRIRIAVADKSKQREIVLFTKTPPAMQLDLISIGKDRFWIEGLNETGVVVRDANHQPVVFAMKDDLVVSLKEARMTNDRDEISRLEILLKKLFDLDSTEKNQTTGRKTVAHEPTNTAQVP